MTRQRARAAPEPDVPNVLARGWWWALGLRLRRAAAACDPRGSMDDRPPPPRASRLAPGSPDLAEIILLPGVYEHWTFLRPLGNALNAAGHRVSVVHGLGMNRRGIAETSERLGRALAKRASRPGRPCARGPQQGRADRQAPARLLGAAAAAPRSRRRPAATQRMPRQAPPRPGCRFDRRTAPLGVLGLVAVCTPFHGSRLAGLFLVPEHPRVPAGRRDDRHARPRRIGQFELRHADFAQARLRSTWVRREPIAPTYATGSRRASSSSGTSNLASWVRTHRTVRASTSVRSR